MAELGYLPRTREYRSPRQRCWKIPDVDVGGDMTGARSVHGSKWKTQQTWRSNEVARFGNMNVNYSQPNELTQDVEIRAPRAVRVVRTLRIGLPATAMASPLRTHTSMTKSKESSFQIAEFAINHPIFAMLVLGMGRCLHDTEGKGLQRRGGTKPDEISGRRRRVYKGRNRQCEESGCSCRAFIWRCRDNRSRDTSAGDQPRLHRSVCS